MKENQVAIVTGNSRGIGAATALALAENGYSICVNRVSDEDAANSIVWPLSSEASYVTGAFIDAAGGR